MGFRGKGLEGRTSKEFLALQHLNHSTERWQWGDLRWILSLEGCWGFIPPGRTSERRQFRCLLCRCHLQGNRIQDLISNRAMGFGGQVTHAGIE